jgi:hypothetical protein
VRAGQRFVIAFLRMFEGLGTAARLRRFAAGRQGVSATVTRCPGLGLCSAVAGARGDMLPRHASPRARAAAVLADLVADPERQFVGYACVRGLQHGRTRQGRPFVDLTLADSSRVVAGKMWDDAPEAMEAARSLARGIGGEAAVPRRATRGRCSSACARSGR